MKKSVILLICICLACGAYGQEMKSIKLNAPDTRRGETTMQAFESRKSTREFAERALTLQDLSDLLWAANGVNRPAEGKRTSPTAMNKQEIDLYVCTADGAYLYDAQAHELKPVTGDDLRSLVAGSQKSILQAPVCLVIVGPAPGSQNEMMNTFVAIDAGIVSQSISLFCSGCGFATVPRGMMERDKLHEALKLGEDRRIYLNHPVGYFR